MLEDKRFGQALMVGLFAGLYPAIFYTFNNLTMLRADGVVVLFALFVLPVFCVSLLAFVLFYHLAGPGRAAAVVVFLTSLFLLFVLYPAWLEISIVQQASEALGERYALIIVISVLAITCLFAFVFQTRLDLYGGFLAALSLAAIFMGALNVVSGTNAAVQSGSTATLPQAVKLKERPNIYFILSDGYTSFAYLNDRGVDVTGFAGFLEGQGFTLYDDAYSNYQPTTSAMPALLNMAHHYYMLNERRVHFSEVGVAARQVIGGDNVLSEVLRNNGYDIHYVHSGSYLLLQGCSADTCFPKSDRLVGAKIILSHIFSQDLLSKADKQSHYLPVSEVRAEMERLMLGADDTPAFYYIHAYTPNHSPNSVAGRCDEEVELANYAGRLESASEYMANQISDITARDPDAVIVLAGDHGPFLSHRCAPLGKLRGVDQYRDRAGILTAIRWPKSYKGELDPYVLSSVNLFRYLLASLAANPTPLLDSVAAEDVFIRDALGHPYVIIKGGQPLPEPQPVRVSLQGN